jgi:hypothetical protein
VSDNDRDDGADRENRRDDRVADEETPVTHRWPTLTA